MTDARDAEAAAREEIFGPLTFLDHDAKCPDNYQRVRNIGPCNCGAGAEANRALDAYRDAIEKRVREERDAEVAAIANRGLFQCGVCGRIGEIHAGELSVHCESHAEERDAEVCTLVEAIRRLPGLEVPSTSRVFPWSDVEAALKPFEEAQP